jgi:hypothetical protein
MSVNSIGSGAVLPLALVAAVGQAPEPQAQQAQVNAQAGLLQAIQSVDLPVEATTTRLGDGKSLDLYL